MSEATRGIAGIAVEQGPSAIPAPRLGFAGVGWIGRLRLQALVDAGAGQVAAIADPDAAGRAQAAALAPGAAQVASFAELIDPALGAGLDGVVIATPSALHAEQAVAALERGLAVFCQKPLGRSAEETGRVIAAARAADRLLGVDLCYRSTAAVGELRRLVASGELGRLYAGRLVFHNAWGPDKPWFYDRSASGGGCVMDLGIHLIDLALELFGRPATRVHSRLFERGRRVAPPLTGVEDLALIALDLEGGAAVDIACSWNMPAGREAVIEVSLIGERGGAAMHNVDGSFYDFVAEQHTGTTRRALCGPPDAWGGRTLVDWCGRLARSPAFDPEVDRLVAVARIIDEVYRGALP